MFVRMQRAKPRLKIWCNFTYQKDVERCVSGSKLLGLNGEVSGDREPRQNYKTASRKLCLLMAAAILFVA